MRQTLRTLASAIGIEGVFLAAGTASLAVGASYVSPAGPWVVGGVAAVGYGIALAVAPRFR